MAPNILLVEDNPDHAVLVQAMLDYRGIGGGVYVSQSVAEAKSYLLAEWPFDDPERNPFPTLMILDHWLEDGTGLEILEWTRSTPGLEGLPVVVFTSCRDAAVQRSAERLGVDGYFLKPEGFEGLGEIIEELIRPKTGESQGDDARDPGAAQAG